MKLKHLTMAVFLAAASTTTAIAGSFEDCVSSVAIEGSFMAGRIFKGKTFIPKANQQEQLKKVARTLAKEGLTISVLDKELGIVTASFKKNSIGNSTPQTTTFSMTFDQKKDGVDASATLSTPGGITTNEESNKKDLCTLLVN